MNERRESDGKTISNDTLRRLVIAGNMLELSLASLDDLHIPDKWSARNAIYMWHKALELLRSETK